MGVTLSEYVQAPANDPYVNQCAAEATALVTTRIGTAPVPPDVLARAVLEVGAELYYRKQARLGIAGLDGQEMTPIRMARDPMRAANDLLAPYTGPAIA